MTTNEARDYMVVLVKKKIIEMSQLNAYVRNEKLSNVFPITCANYERDPIVALRTSRWYSTSRQKFYNKGCLGFAVTFRIQ